MKIFAPQNDDRENHHPLWEHVRSKGHAVYVGRNYDEPWSPDAIVSYGITCMEEGFIAVNRFPEARLYCYCWDCYNWVWTNPRPGEYDYKRYGELLRLADEVWVPSMCTAVRLTQWWPEIKRAEVIKSACPWWEHNKVDDRGYALCCLREIPDEWWGVFERCCRELKIEYVSTRHLVTEQEYRDTVAGCRFICAPLCELSTGGLSLMEAHYLGKPVLLSDSQWNGGRDYMGDRATYFKHGDINDFKLALATMFYYTPQLDRAECKAWIETNYSDQRMGDDIIRRLAVE